MMNDCRHIHTSQACALDEQRKGQASDLLALREPHGAALARLRVSEARRLEDLRSQHAQEVRRKVIGANEIKCKS